MRERLTGALVDVMLDADFYAAAISDRVAFWRGEWGITYAPFVTVDDEVMGGMPVFRGTRVAVGVVLDNLQDGMTLDAILGEYETLNRADIEAVLEIRRKLPVP
jgi:uncharacterized protein (DUF433 family)